MTLVVICMQACGRNPWSTLLGAAITFLSNSEIGGNRIH